MNIGLYAGSFNPWHKGHEDILNKALMIFDKVIILQSSNPLKKDIIKLDPSLFNQHNDKVVVEYHYGLLKDYISDKPIKTMIRGLRNPQDLEYEKTLQYVNEDLGITIPTMFFLTDRSLCHVSSSAIRQLEHFGVYDVL